MKSSQDIVEIRQESVEIVKQPETAQSTEIFIAAGLTRIDSDLPKGSLDVSKIFRRIEQSHETNLLDSLSKSLEKSGSQNGNRHADNDHLLASATLNLLDADDLLKDDNEGDDLLQADGSKSDILNMLDDEL